MSSSLADIDALFGAPAPSPPPPAPAPPPAATHSSFPNLGDARRELRVRVSWPGRVQLPNGRVAEVRVRDLGESGVGLLTEHHIPPDTVLNFAMSVPDLHDPTKTVPVSGSIRTGYIVLKGRDLSSGATWVSLPEARRDLLDQWIRRLRK